jgi:hypothetical protein
MNALAIVARATYNNREEKRQAKRRLTSTAHARRLNPRAPRASLRSHSLAPLQPQCALPMQGALS